MWGRKGIKERQHCTADVRVRVIIMKIKTAGFLRYGLMGTLWRPSRLNGTLFCEGFGHFQWLLYDPGGSLTLLLYFDPYVNPSLGLDWFHF